MISERLGAVTPITKSELKEILGLATTDIKVNRVAHKRRTSLRDVVEIEVISLRVLKRPQVLVALTAK